MLLVIGKTRSDANAVSDIFKYMGVVSHGTTLDMVANEFSNRHRAILFIHPEDMSSLEELIRTARTYSLNSLVFAIRKNSNDSVYGEKELNSLFDDVFEEDAISSDILFRIINLQNERGKPMLGSYRLAGIDASINLNSVSYFDTRIDLTKTQTMILRFLIASYPIKQTAKDVLKYAFRSGKVSEPSSIRAHICSINSKLAAATGKHTIVSERGLGYYLNVEDEKIKLK